jgi:hypothetical protein
MAALAIRLFSKKASVMASLGRSCLTLGTRLVSEVLCARENALDPSRHISQYGQKVSRVQDGAIDPAGEITQTADGYPWLGTSNGLSRFDGVRFVPALHQFTCGGRGSKAGTTIAGAMIDRKKSFGRLV